MSDNPDFSETLLALRRAIKEEVVPLRALVDDVDSCCISRIQRRSRLAAFESVLDLLDLMETWTW